MEYNENNGVHSDIKNFRSESRFYLEKSSTREEWLGRSSQIRSPDKGRALVQLVMASCSNNIFCVCDGCDHNITSFIELSVSDKQLGLLKFLYDHSVIPKNKKWPVCGFDMWLDKRIIASGVKNVLKISSHRKKVKVQCDKPVSQFAGMWFEGSKLSVKTNCRFVLFWCLLNPPRQYILTKELFIASDTVVNWYNFVREVCFHFFCLKSKPIGGVGIVVEIDEAKIGHRKYNRGRIVEGSWIFGGIDRESKEVFIVPVATRGHATLLPTIHKFILPGTTVISDCWRTYNCLKFECYIHLTVNHSYNFIDPDTGAHTQTIEHTWREVRSKVPRFGNRKHHLHGHIAEFILKRKYSDYSTRVHFLWCAISELYNGGFTTESSTPPDAGIDSNY